MFHLFSTLRVIHNVTPSIWSEHDHGAVATALVHRQNSAFCVSDFKIDAQGAASSVGEGTVRLTPQCCYDSPNTLSTFILLLTVSVGTDVA